MERVVALLHEAQRPLFLLGGSSWDDDAWAAMGRLAGELPVPVCVSFRRQDLFANDHPSYAGDLSLGADPELLARLNEADLLIAVGARLGEVTTGGYRRIPRGAAQRLVHVHPGVDELGRVYRPDVPVLAGAAEFVRALARAAPRPGPGWAEWTARAHAGYEASSRTLREDVGAVDPARAVLALRDALPPDAIVSNGAGNFSTWLHRYFRYLRPHTQLAPTAGAMGYGVPAAIGAKAAFPGRTVVAVTGDGDFLMTGQELATAVQYELPIVVLLLNNGKYGTIRAHQERAYPGRTVGTDLRNPDFVRLAEAYGCTGARVTRTADVPDALRDALHRRHPGADRAGGGPGPGQPAPALQRDSQRGPGRRLRAVTAQRRPTRPSSSRTAASSCGSSPRSAAPGGFSTRTSTGRGCSSMSTPAWVSTRVEGRRRVEPSASVVSLVKMIQPAVGTPTILPAPSRR